MTALIKYGVGSIIMVVLFGCQPTSAPTVSVPSVSPEQFETPSPEPISTAGQGQPSSSLSQDALPLAVYAGTYRCETLLHQAANSITLEADGTYRIGAIAGNYTSSGKAGIELTSGALLSTYV